MALKLQFRVEQLASETSQKVVQWGKGCIFGMAFPTEQYCVLSGTSTFLVRPFLQREQGRK